MSFNWPADDLTVKEKVGVGTDTPTEKLDVKGNIKLNTGVAVGEFSSDGTFANPTDLAVPTNKAVKTYVDNQIANTNTTLTTQITSLNTALANKADTISLTNKADQAGSIAQDFQTNNLTVQGNLQVTGTTTFRDVEQHQGDLELGNEDGDRVKIHGTLLSTHSSGTLPITSPINVGGKITANANWTGEEGALSLIGDKPTIRFNGGAAAGNQSWILHVGSNGPGNFEFYRRTGAASWANLMTLTPSGNVGIGLASPDARLFVYTTTNNGGNNTAAFYAPNIGPNASHIHWGSTGDWYIRSASPAGKVFLQDTGGGVSIPTARLSFGASVRQMINLWNEDYGIGVQSATTYFRTGANFCWFRGGVHNNTRDNPGGGVRLMALNEWGDFILSARTNPNGNPGGSLCRALADLGNKLMINVNNDYPQGVDIVNGRFVSSRDLKQNVADLSTEEAIAALHDLSPVKFSYRTDDQQHRHVGFIAEEVPDLLAAPDRRSIGALDVVAVLTKVVQEQQATIATLKDQVQSLVDTINHNPRNLN